jgi:hypothetical protein
MLGSKSKRCSNSSRLSVVLADSSMATLQQPSDFVKLSQKYSSNRILRVVAKLEIARLILPYV